MQGIVLFVCAGTSNEKTVVSQQVQTDAQLAALNEQYDQERTMLLDKLSEQMQEIKSMHDQQLAEVQAQLADSNQSVRKMHQHNEELEEQLKQVLVEYPRRMEKMEQDHEEALLNAVREALEPVDSELAALRKDRDDFLQLKKKYQELQALIEPFRVISFFSSLF